LRQCYAKPDPQPLAHFGFNRARSP